MNSEANKVRKEIIEKTIEYFNIKFSNQTFTPGSDYINYAGRVFDEKELVNAVEAAIDYWLTEGRFSKKFADTIGEFLNINHVLLTNSGSSANLLAVSALTSEKLGDKRLKPGDEVISVAASFPSTITPIIQTGLIPVFVDVDIPTYNININMLQKAINPNTKCIFIAHTLGNPFNLDAVVEIANKHNIWIIEDNCDALGSRYRQRFTGTFGHLSTLSFYPAHHITTGEGGAVCTNDPQLAKIVKSFRDWGRDCYCRSGVNNTCGKRFSHQFGLLPQGYDHKYVYSELGYNLKMTEFQAAIGVAQMDKLTTFCKKRKENFQHYLMMFNKYSDYFILPEPVTGSDPAWFGFIVTLKQNCTFNRNDITRFLNRRFIETRNIFAGNITKQPAFYNKTWRIVGHLNNTDYIMHNSFFLGTYPGMTSEKMDYIEKVLDEFFLTKIIKS